VHCRKHGAWREVLYKIILKMYSTYISYGCTYSSVLSVCTLIMFNFNLFKILPCRIMLDT
jgi:hypothetical protein